MSFLYELKDKEAIMYNRSRDNIGLIIPDHKYDNDDKRYVALMNSMSHTYGNALAFAQKYLIGLFPPNMFRTIHVNSKIAHRQIRSTTSEFIKKEKPMIIFRPRIPSITEDRFMANTPLMERQSDVYSLHGESSLQPFFNDTKNGICIKYQMNRVILYVDVVIVLATLMQQLDYYHYIANAVRLDIPFMVNTFMESYIDQTVLKVLGDCANVPLYDKTGSIKPFLDYMNSHSIYPINYALQTASKTKEFYRLHPENILMTITDLEKDDGDRVGHIMDHYNISFTLKMEFNTDGFNFIFSKNYNKFQEIRVSINDTIIPHFTDSLDESSLSLPIGWNLFTKTSCILEDPDEVVPIDDVLNSSILQCLNYHQKNGMPPTNFIDIQIRKQGEYIRLGEDFTIDWDNLSIKFINQDIYNTFTICISINTEYINSLLKQVFGFVDADPNIKKED